MAGFLELHNLRRVIANPNIQRPWVRSPLYLHLPEIQAQDQRFVGLYAIFPTNSYLAFRCHGNYVVDWGDGQIQSFWGGQAAEHFYNFSSIPTSTIEDRGFKQVIVQIYPQSNQNLTSIDLNVKHSSATGPASLMTGWTDIEVNAPQLTSLQIGGSWSAIQHRLLEQFALTSSKLADFSYFFNQCSALRKVVALETSVSITTIEGMYRNCHSLDEIVTMDGANVSSFRYLFENCYKLRKLPELNYSNVTNMSYMCAGCVSLESTPVIPSAKATNAAYMFSGCANLNQITDINMSKVTSAGSMFADCVSLKKAILSGAKTDLDLSDAKLSIIDLLALFGSLGSTSNKIINVSGSWGSAALTAAQRNIALNKGWTIIG